jgi:hypothetical protein
VVPLALDRKSRMATGAELGELLRPGVAGDVIRCKAELMPGGRWLKITPVQPLAVGEYALVELLGQASWNADVWDFGIDPRAAENHNSFSPLTAASPAP